MKFTLTPLLSGYDCKITTVSSSERSAKLDSFTCTIHPFIKPTDVIIGVFNVRKAYYLNKQRTIRIQSHNRLQTVFSFGQLDHLFMTRNTIFIFRWFMESRNNNNNNNEVKLRLRDQKRTLVNKQVEHSLNPQHSNSSQHSEYFGNRKVRESRNEQKRTSKQFPSDLKRESIIEELAVLLSTKNWFSAQLNKESM